MKEATGELSMTAVVVLVIAVVAVAAPIIVKTVGNSAKMKTLCETSVCTACNSGTKTCTYKPDATDTDPVGTEDGTSGLYKITCNC